jgi:hypothetical protein
MQHPQVAAMMLGSTAGPSWAFALNNSKLMWGLCAILLNFGSRFLVMDVTPAQQALFQHPLFKRVVIVCMFFMVTRDVLLSVALGAVAIVVLESLLNEKSRFCLLPAAMRAAAVVNPMHHHPAIKSVLDMSRTATVNRERFTENERADPIVLAWP